MLKEREGKGCIKFEINHDTGRNSVKFINVHGDDVLSAANELIEVSAERMNCTFEDVLKLMRKVRDE